MAHRTVSWTRISRSGHDARPSIPVGLLGARALIQLGTRARPLVVAGRFDLAAIMSAACKAATGLQERLGLSRRETLSIALKAAWQAARMARTAAAH